MKRDGTTKGVAMELLESILSRVNMQRAFKQVMRNKGSGGVDGVEIEGFTTQVEKEWPEIRARIQEREQLWVQAWQECASGAVAGKAVREGRV
jgi:hypothetical protein